jgi:uncharacterized protein YecE (DUF72 family)
VSLAQFAGRPILIANTARHCGLAAQYGDLQKLGPILWQLPATLAFDADVLGAFLDELPRTTSEAAELGTHHDHRLDGRALTTTDADRPLRHALEVRHPGYEDPATTGRLADLLRARDVALVLADTAGKWPFLDTATASFGYVRLHGDTELYRSGYSDEALDRWAARLAPWAAAGRDVWVYFDNDAKAHAPFDATALTERLGHDPAETG